MTPVVLDASVATAWFVDEPGSEALRSLRSETVSLRAPHFLQVEFANALWRKSRRGEFDQAMILPALADLKEFDIRWTPDADLVNEAAALAILLSHSVYDCLYLALAQHTRGQLATLDKRLATLANSAEPSVELWTPSQS